MADTELPDFFQRFPMEAVRDETLDAALAATPAGTVAVLFLWGRDCPNCDIAKRAMLRGSDRFRPDRLRWLHGNVYDDAAIGNRFALHGGPVFFLFRGGEGSRPLGRITGWPGEAAFVAAVSQQIGNAAAA